MADAWTILTSNSLVSDVDAWEHLQNQGGSGGSEQPMPAYLSNIQLANTPAFILSVGKRSINSVALLSNLLSKPNIKTTASISNIKTVSIIYPSKLSSVKSLGGTGVASISSVFVS